MSSKNSRDIRFAQMPNSTKNNRKGDGAQLANSYRGSTVKNKTHEFNIDLEQIKDNNEKRRQGKMSRNLNPSNQSMTHEGSAQQLAIKMEAHRLDLPTLKIVDPSADTMDAQN
jgi:hypothetical protein